MIAALLLLFACTGAPGDVILDIELIQFPHSEDYKTGAIHGAESIAAGATACLGCHRDDSTAPTCASCHPAYPHVTGWIAGATHGVGLAGPTAVEPLAACQSCHAVEAAAAPACTSCHGSFPHPAGWALGGQHGAWALSHGPSTAACGACHGPTLAGTATAPACSKCHAAYPHPTGWRDPAQHGVADLTTCASCHGADGVGGSSGVACSRCHASYPHVAGWAAGHVAVANKVGEAVCLDCHEAGDGPTLPASCGATCHGGKP